MDFGELALKHETVTPLHPEHGDVGLRIQVCEPMSREYTRAVSRIASDKLDADVFLAEAVTIGWSAEGDLKNLPEYSEQAASDMYRDPRYAWVVAAINRHIDKKKGFMDVILNKLQNS